MTERDIPVLKPGVPAAPADLPQPAADAVSRRLYQAVSPGVVQIDAPGGRGSGFILDAQGHVATDAHVADIGRELTVLDANGKRYAAKIEKFDGVTDLSILSVPGLRGSDAALQYGTSTKLKADDPLYAFGYPLGYRPAYISPGVLTRQTTEKDSILDLRKRGGEHPGFLPMKHAFLTGATGDGINPAVTSSPTDQTADEQLSNRRVLQARLHIEPGNSGGPLTDEKGKVVGISDYINAGDASESYYTPVEALKELAAKPSKYEFHYTEERRGPIVGFAHLWQQDPALAAIGTGLGGGAAYLGYGGMMKYPTAVAGGLMYLGGRELYDDFNKFRSSGDTQDKVANGLAMIADAATVAGGALQFTSKLKAVGRIAVAAGILGRMGTESIPTHTVLTGANYIFNSSDGNSLPVDGSSSTVEPRTPEHIPGSPLTPHAMPDAPAPSDNPYQKYYK